MSSRAARSNNGCLTNSRICTWYVMMDPKITPSGQTIVKPTALGPVANTDTKLLIYDLFQKGRVLAQNDHQVATLLSDGRVEVEGVPYARLSEAAAARLVKILERPAGQQFAPFRGLLESGIAVGYVFLPGAQFVACSSPRRRFERAVRTPGGPVARHPQPRGRKPVLRREIPWILRGFQGRLSC